MRACRGIDLGYHITTNRESYEFMDVPYLLNCDNYLFLKEHEDYKHSFILTLFQS